MASIRIITPIGLSLFTNFFDTDKNKGSEGIKQDYNALNDKRGGQYDKEKCRIKTLKKGIEKFIKTDNACAEISSINKILEKFPENEFYLNFLPSDTILSIIAGELIKKSGILESRSSQIKDVTVEPFIEGLQIENEQEFIQKGMKYLIQKISDFKNQGQSDLMINITGGYKAAIPYLTIMGQLYDIPLFYTFEETNAKSTELIRIPQAPVNFDFTFLDEDYDILKLIKNGKNLSELRENLSKTRKIEKKNLETLKKHGHIEERDGKFFLTLMGELIFNRYKDIRSKGFRNDYSVMRSNLIELKIFEYYVGKYSSAKVTHSKKFEKYKNKVLEADIFIELDDEIVSVEVKPATQLKEIEKKFKKEMFNCLFEGYEKKSITLEFILYSYMEMNIVSNNIKVLHDKYHSNFKSIKWYQIDRLDKYKKDSHWKIDDQKLREIKLS